MRTLLKVSIPVKSGNKTIKDGTLPKTIQELSEAIRPEAAYFYAENGKRTALFVFDMKDPSQIPAVAEPLFMNLEASVDFWPLMNEADLKAGLEKWAKSNGKAPVTA